MIPAEAAKPVKSDSMSPTVEITVNGERMQVRADTTVAAAILMAGGVCRTSVSGEPRGPLCGMGICMECRAIVDGIAQRRTCLLSCSDGMVVTSG